jgi:hypothetical protein
MGKTMTSDATAAVQRDAKRIMEHLVPADIAYLPRRALQRSN